MSDLLQKKCVPCEGGVARLNETQCETLLLQVPAWQIMEGRKLTRRFIFDDFVTAMSFVNKMAALAEEEGHHPDFALSYSVVDATVWTHAIGGLSDNDFVLAAKIDQIDVPQSKV